jgi:hypothetical protein
MATLAILDTADRVAGLDLNTASLVAATSGGDSIPAGADIYLRVKTAGTNCTVTAMAAGANAGPSGTFLAPLALGAVGATGDRMYGPFPASTFADPSDGLVHLAYSAVTSVTVGVYQLTNQ